MDTQKPPRKWWLKILAVAIVVVLLTLLITFYASIRAKDAAELKAIEWIRAIGGSYSTEQGFMSDLLEWANHTLPGVDLDAKGFGRIIRVDLQGTDVMDADLQHLKGLSDVQTLALRRAKVTGRGLAHLKGSDILDLELSDSQVTDEGLKSIGELHDLEILDISRTQITDAGMKHLRGLTRLRHLALNGTQVSDAGLVYLKDLVSLRELNLTKHVSDAGLVHLKGLVELRELRVPGGNVTDQGLVHLKGLKNLQELDLVGTRVTREGIAELQRALPNATIDGP